MRSDDDEEEDETVDVESYGDETVSWASMNNNNEPKLNSVQTPIRPLNPADDRNIIISRNSLWHYNKHNRIGDTSVLMGNDSNGIHGSSNNNAPPTATTILEANGTNIARATPTSSDQLNEYNHENEDSAANTRSHHQSSRSTNNCDADNGEEVIVDNTDDEEYARDMPSVIERSNRSVDRNRLVEKTIFSFFFYLVKKYIIFKICLI